MFDIWIELDKANAAAKRQIDRKARLRALRSRVERDALLVPATDCHVSLPGPPILALIDAEIATCDAEITAITERLRETLTEPSASEVTR